MCLVGLDGGETDYSLDVEGKGTDIRNEKHNTATHMRVIELSEALESSAETPFTNILGYNSKRSAVLFLFFQRLSNCVTEKSNKFVNLIAFV